MDDIKKDNLAPQEKVAGQPAFTPKESDKAQGDLKKDEKKKGGPMVWIFIGGCLFLFIILMVVCVYMLNTEGGARVFEAIGLPLESARIAIRNIVNGIYIFFTIVLVIILLVGGALLASADKDVNMKRKGVYITIFSVVSIMFLAISYIALFPILYNNYSPTGTTQSYAEYISVSPNPPTGSAPYRVFLDATALNQLSPDLFYQWDFGDSSDPGTGIKVSHEYKKPGIFQIKLIVSNAKESKDVETGITVLIHNAAATPIIITDIKQGQAPLEVQFDASTSTDPNGQIIDYLWDFGDTESSSNQAKGAQAIHVFDKPGTYEVVLNIVDENNEKISTKQSILVLSKDAGIIPKIVASPLEGVSPLKVDFNASSSSHSEDNVTLTKFEWDFGDATPVIRSRETAHTFSEEGVYDVTLTITDSENNTKQETLIITVSDKGKSPEAKIVTTPAVLAGKAPFRVELDASSSIDPDGEIVSYKWTFPEGPEETGPKTEYTFTKPGQYPIILEIEDNDGKKGTTSVVAVVNEQGLTPPVAKIDTDPSPAQGLAPLIITFDASKSNDPDGDIISYSWDFGDKSKEVLTTAPTISHKFEKVGIWPVTLTITDNDGLTETADIKIAVTNSTPTAVIIPSKVSGIAPVVINFDASDSSGDITNYSWNFGDGKKDSGMNIKHTFENAGTFKVVLTITDAQRQVSTADVSISIK